MRCLWLNSGRTNQRQKATVDVSSCYPMGTVLVVKHNFTKVLCTWIIIPVFCESLNSKDKFLCLQPCPSLQLVKVFYSLGRKK